MDTILFSFLHGLILAFGLILPLGPQNTFVFNQGASQNHLLRALPVTLAASLCDTILILLAVSGVSVVVIAVPSLHTILICVGVLFLCYTGWVMWQNELKLEGGDAQNKAIWPVKRQILFTMSISLLNPHAILDTIGVIGTSATAYQKSERLFFTLACISVSWMWFLALTLLGHLASNITIVRRYLPRASAIIIWLSAFYLCVSALIYW